MFEEQPVATTGLGRTLCRALRLVNRRILHDGTDKVKKNQLKYQHAKSGVGRARSIGVPSSLPILF
jgi:hypothetical protein